MVLELKRRFKDPEYTIGSLYINGKYLCDTLEDTVRDLSKEAKIKHKTAIPEGQYIVIVNRSPRFKRDLPRLLNVPLFEGILIHAGNSNLNTSGCILVGENKIKGKLVNSKYYEEKLTSTLKEIQRKGEGITIKVY